MQITSTNFDNMEPIPKKYTPYGDNINPLLTFSEIPDGTESLALIVEDPDTPSGAIVTHWIVYNMSPGTLQIIEGELPLSGVEGVNYTGNTGYTGPKPPSGNHRYMFKLFALDTMLEFSHDEIVDRAKVDDAIQGHINEEAQIIGTYAYNPEDQEA